MHSTTSTSPSSSLDSVEAKAKRPLNLVCCPRSSHVFSPLRRRRARCSSSFKARVGQVGSREASVASAGRRGSLVCPTGAMAGADVPGGGKTSDATWFWTAARACERVTGACEPASVPSTTAEAGALASSGGTVAPAPKRRRFKRGGAGERGSSSFSESAGASAPPSCEVTLGAGRAEDDVGAELRACLLYTSPSPRDRG